MKTAQKAFFILTLIFFGCDYSDKGEGEADYIRQAVGEYEVAVELFQETSQRMEELRLVQEKILDKMQQLQVDSEEMRFEREKLQSALTQLEAAENALIQMNEAMRPVPAEAVEQATIAMRQGEENLEDIDAQQILSDQVEQKEQMREVAQRVDFSINQGERVLDQEI